MPVTLLDADVLIKMARAGDLSLTLMQALWGSIPNPAITDSVLREATQKVSASEAQLLRDFLASEGISPIQTGTEAAFRNGSIGFRDAGDASMLEVLRNNPSTEYSVFSDNTNYLNQQRVSVANNNATLRGSADLLNDVHNAGNFSEADYAHYRDAMRPGVSPGQASRFLSNADLGLKASYNPVRGAVDYTPIGSIIPSGDILINPADRPSIPEGVAPEDAVQFEISRIQGSADPIESLAGRGIFGEGGGSIRLGTALGIAGLGLAALDGITSAEAAYSQYQAGDVDGAQQTLEGFGARLAGALIGGEIGGEFGGLPGALIGSLVGGFLGNSAVFGADAVAHGLEHFANSVFGAVSDLLSGALDALAEAAGLGLDGMASLLDPAAPEQGEGGADGASRRMGEANEQISPLVLDIKGDGINLTSLSGSAPYFDLGATGFAHKTGWIGSGSGLLALDRNGNGVIDSGLELFGTAGAASDGFAALRTLDSNHDNVIDANDVAFSQLRVWIDADRDALTDAGELLTLAELGIASISLTATGVTQTNAGNTIKLISSYTLSNGTQRAIADVYFTNSLTFTKPDTPVALTPDVAALPQLHGYGTMLDLRSAAMTDATLKGQVGSLLANIGQGPQAGLAAIKSLVLEWSHSASIDPASRGGLFDARQLDFLEKYTGVAFYDGSYFEDWVGQPTTPRWRSAIMLEEGWNAAYDSIAARLLLQSGYNLPEFKYVGADDMVLPTRSWQDSLADLYSRLGDISAANAAEWDVAMRVADAFRLDARLSASAFLASVANATSGSIAAISSALIFGQHVDVAANGDMTITGTTENATLYAGPKVRAITIAPQPSSAPPPLRNTVIFNGGSGSLELNFTDYSGHALNSLVLGANVAASSITTRADRSGNLYIADGVAGDEIKVGRVLADISSYGVQSLYFSSSGTTWDSAAIAQLGLRSTAGADVLYGTVGADLFNGGGGSDYAFGRGGNDTFLYNAGYGALEISETDFAANPNNILKLGAGITAAQVKVTGDSTGNLFLADGIAGDQIKLDSMLSGSYYGVQRVQFADGTSWTRAQIIALAAQITGGTGNDRLFGTPGADTFDGRGGNDYEQGNGGGDTFLYNAGYGALEISETDFASNPNNILKLGSGITAAQLKVTGDSSGNLFITDGIPGDQIKIDTMLSGSYYGVQGVQFADGTSWTRAQLILQETTGTAGADSLYGTPGADIFDGKGGNDRLTGRAGSDTFIFSGAFGADTVTDFDATGTAHDLLQFDAPAFSTASAALAAAHQVGADVVIASGADSVTLKGINVASLTVADFRIQ
jgi:Ca2+-binding RTX toxin-like protein